MKTIKDEILKIDLNYIINNLKRVIDTKESLMKKDFDKIIVNDHLLKIFEEEIIESIDRLTSIKENL